MRSETAGRSSHREARACPSSERAQTKGLFRNAVSSHCIVWSASPIPAYAIAMKSGSTHCRRSRASSRRICSSACSDFPSGRKSSPNQSTVGRTSSRRPKTASTRLRSEPSRETRSHRSPPRRDGRIERLRDRVDSKRCRRAPAPRQRFGAQPRRDRRQRIDLSQPIGERERLLSPVRYENKPNMNNRPATSGSSRVRAPSPRVRPRSPRSRPRSRSRAARALPPKGYRRHGAFGRRQREHVVFVRRHVDVGEQVVDERDAGVRLRVVRVQFQCVLEVGERRQHPRG